MAPNEAIDPQAFIDSYGPDAPVAFPNGTSVTLGQALQMEAAFCPADTARRQDPVRRVRYLAGLLLAGGSLNPEDEQYLTAEE